MAIRISGVNLPDQKRIEIALMSIYGIGRSVSQRILDDLKIDDNIELQTAKTKAIAKIISLSEQKV